jgi:hypothetical protein
MHDNAPRISISLITGAEKRIALSTYNGDVPISP